MIFLVAIVMFYYNVIIAWTIYYMVASFEDVLPWANCGNTWNSQHCFSYDEFQKCKATDGAYFEGKCLQNSTFIVSAFSMAKTPPAEEYYRCELEEGCENLNCIV
jgi:SNF family Na+-dependent transporter